MDWSRFFPNPWPPTSRLYGRPTLTKRIVEDSGWSHDQAIDEFKSDGAARTRAGRTYLLTDSYGDAIPRDPREPVLIGVWVLDEEAGEWELVGSQEFPDLRAALRGWQSIPVDR